MTEIVDLFDRRFRMAYAALSIAESVVTLATVGYVRPWWSSLYMEDKIRKIARARRERSDKEACS